MKCPDRNERGRRIASILSAVLAVATASTALGQAAAAPAAAPEAPKTAPAPAVPTDEEVYVLSPFVVTAEEDSGYVATATLAGTRLRSDLRDIGSAITVVTEQFLRDTGSRTIEDLLVYTTSTEIGGTMGNTSGVGLGRSTDETGSFTRQNTNSRVRGLSGAENTRDFFLTDIPWDSYNVGRVDMQRGPNSILFGLGSPAGIVNAGLNQASFKNSRRVDTRFDKFGSFRASLDINQVILKQELAVRLSMLRDRTKYRQNPAYNDDDRIYAAVRYDPSFLAKNGNKTTFRLNYEKGDITALRPRTLPPIDRITPWFRTDPYVVAPTPLFGKPQATYPALNRQTFNNWDVNVLRRWVPNTGITNQGGRAWISPDGNSSRYEWNSVNYVNDIAKGWRQNLEYQPWISEWYAGALFGYFEGNQYNPSPSGNYATGTTLFNGLNPDGIVTKNSNNELNGGIDAFPYTQMQAVSEPWKVAKGVGTPFYGAYRDPSLTNTNVFDFYNNLLDGNSRRSWRGFHAVSAAVDQTFLNNRLGFSLAYDRQGYEDGQNYVLSERNQAVNVDVNATYSHSNMPNPNAGRAFIGGGGGGGNQRSQREERRVTAFGEFRATDVLSKGWLADSIGKHVFTVLASKNRYDRDNLGWTRFMLNPADVTFLPNMGTSNGGLQFQPTIYISPNLQDKAKYPTVDSLHLTAASAQIAPKTVTVNYFNSNWKRSTVVGNADYVNPGAEWFNPYFQNPADPNSGRSTQSENPANYVGWTSKSVRILDAENPADREQMITYLAKSRMKISTKAFVWQGFFFNGNIVPTFGYRDDKARAYSYTASKYNKDIPTSGAQAANNLIDIDHPLNVLPTTTTPLHTINRSWSIVAHTPEFIRKRLPWGTGISLTYNTSSNFNPNDAGRRNFWGNEIAPSSGKTRDVGVLVSALNNKVSLRVVRFKTSNKDVGAGNPMSGIMQLESRGWVMAKRLEAGLTGAANRQGEGFNFGDRIEGVFVQTPADLEKQRAVVAAVLGNVPQDIFKAWGIDTTSNRWENNWDLAVAPSRVTSIQDRASEGWEYELNLRPIPNWSISANVAKISSQLDNTYNDILPWVIQRNEFWNGIAGRVPYPNGLPSGQPNGDAWNANVMAGISSALVANGEKVQEMVPTRFNLVTNYDFNKGRLKGVSVGGAYRWEDKAAIGYHYKYLQLFGRTMEVRDLSKPVYGKKLSGFDLWVGYKRKIAKNLEWKIQVNVRNVGDKNTLVPIGTNPDGSVAVYRIKDGMAWSCQNTFNF